MTAHECALVNEEAVVKESSARQNGALTEEQIKLRLEVLRADPRVKTAIREGEEAMAAKPSRSTVYATKEDFLRAFD